MTNDTLTIKQWLEGLSEQELAGIELLTTALSVPPA